MGSFLATVDFLAYPSVRSLEVAAIITIEIPAGKSVSGERGFQRFAHRSQQRQG